LSSSIDTIRTIASHDAAFPALLRDTSGHPDTLYVRGVFPFDGLGVAIVGTRKASSFGISFAHDLAARLSGAGFVVVSGLALGIDAAAHKGALSVGGRTVAVLACGLDTIYPQSHVSLSQRILDTDGALVSEYATGTPALPHQFLARNRIISGLSIATVVVEAPARSGSLSTARHALEQGREVYVVPGAVSDRRYGGSHEIIRDGARLVTSADDILQDFASLTLQYPELTEMVTSDGGASAPDPSFDTDDERAIFEAIRDAGKSLTIDTLTEITTLEPHIVSHSLTSLTVLGVVTEGGGKYFVK